MRASFLIILTFFYCLIAKAQNDPANNLLIGYQEFPTVIQGQTSDAQGNLYYTGYFKGQLKVGSDVVATGKGLEDIFWVKTDPNGALLRYKTFGSAYSEMTFPDALVMGKGDNMFFMTRISSPIAFDATTVTPYSVPPGASPSTNCLINTDTAGTIKWVKKTNLLAVKLLFANNVLHVFGNVNIFQPAIKWGDSTVVDSLGMPALVHLMLDTSGNILGKKIILLSHPSHQINLQQCGVFKNNDLFLSVRFNAMDSFSLNGHKVILPSALGGYYVLIKTDTAYKQFKTKVLNPERQPVSGAFSVNLPIALAPNDSLYTVLNYEGSPLLSLDGHSLPPQRNELFVLDTSLKVARTSTIGPSFIASYSGSSVKRRLFYRNILFLNNRLFFTGQYTGINESPATAIPVRDTTVPALFTTTATVDLNGPSKSFVAKCDLNGNNSSLIWTGAHTPYENLPVFPTSLYPVNNNRFTYILSFDNVWNPWLVDTALQIISGAMRSNADQPEIPQMIQYFPDGSRVLLGFAKGKTSLDSSNKNITSNNLRSDVFLVRIRPNNEVVWFKRFYSTLLAPEARKLEVRNNKAYFLIDYLNTQNDSNFIRVENTTYDVKVNASLLASIDTSGNINVLNLRNPTYRYAYLRDFSFFANGDLAVLANQFYAIPFKNFPPSGMHLLRVQEGDASIVDARKIYGIVMPNFQSIQVDKDDRIYLSGMASVNPTGQLLLHNGSATIDTLVITKNNAEIQMGLLKMDWNRFTWNKQFSGAAYSNTSRQLGDLFLQNNRPVLLVNSINNNQPLLWNGASVHNGPYAGHPTFVGLDTAGVMIRTRVIPDVLNPYTRKGSNGQFYISGWLLAATQIDTISIGNAGGADGIGLVLDSNFKIKKSFRIATVYNERLLDMDLYKDSVAAFAYLAQSTPQIFNNRTAIQTSDYNEDAYVSTAVSRTNITTGLNEPLPARQSVNVVPNPITGHQVQLEASVPNPLRAVCFVYNNSGQFISSAVVTFAPGSGYYRIALPPTAKPGVYYVVINTKSWTTTRRFTVL